MPKQATAEALAAWGSSDSPGTGVAGSRRSRCGFEIARAADGAITSVRIGAWRKLGAGPQRRLAEVRELPGERIAVRVERLADLGDRPSSQIWQVYDFEGRLEAAMQTTPDGKFAVLSDYRSRRGTRLVRNQQNELQTLETWRI